MSRAWGLRAELKARGGGNAWTSLTMSVTGMVRRSEESANRRKSCPGALTKGI
jgi:hypothetical protein